MPCALGAKLQGSFHGLKVSLPLWDALNEAVESWSLLAQEKLAPVEIGHRIVVLDTSALMEHPELLQGLSSSDILVVPLRVLSELDGLKSSEDETRAVKARAAIRQLDANSSRIRHETDYAALLPAEWDARQPDHAILSTALFFRLNDVLFVSNDINLRNKAQSLGLNTQDSKSYAPSRLVPAAAASEAYIHGSKINKKIKGNETMSRADEYRYQIQRQRKQELDRQRVRETTRPFLERYRSVLNDVASQGLGDVIPAEFRELSSELRRMEALLESDPFAARDMSRSLGGRFHGLPRFAREQRRSRQEAELAAAEAFRNAQQAEVERQLQVKAELEAAWREGLSGWSTPVALNAAFAELQQLRERLLGNAANNMTRRKFQPPCAKFGSDMKRTLSASCRK
jgi:rRNA-processing protein FCF1